MGERINKEFEDFQKVLAIRSKKLKEIVNFECDDNLDIILNELKNKEVVL